MSRIAASSSTVMAAAPTRMTVAIGCALAAFFLFTCMDSAVKLLSATWPVLQIGFFNALFAMLPMLPVLLARRGAALRTRRLPLHILRGLCSVTGTGLAFFAYSRVPIADAYAILFTMPLIITALSVPVLGESVGWRRWIAVLVGFSGILVMLRPGGGLLDLAALAALGAAVANAVSVLLLRRMQRTESVETCIFFGNLTVLTVLGLLLPLDFTWPSAGALGISLLGGALAGAAALLQGVAYRHGPAALVAPFQYSQMPYGLLSGWLIYRTVPEPIVLVGGAIVIGSGLYILHRERVLQRGVASGTIFRAPLWQRGRRPSADDEAVMPDRRGAESAGVE